MEKIILEATDAIVSFLTSAASLQQAGSIVIDTQEPDKEFESFYGYSKDELNTAIEKIMSAVKNAKHG